MKSTAALSSEDEEMKQISLEWSYPLRDVPVIVMNGQRYIVITIVESMLHL